MQALSQDQLRTLLKLKEALNFLNLNVGIYDGDTSKEDRAWIRDNARIVCTNFELSLIYAFLLPLICLISVCICLIVCTDHYKS